MNYTGIIRRVDELGRIVIPVEIRKILNIKVGENLEIIINDGKIELKKKSLTKEYISFFSSISNLLDEIVDGSYFISDREKIIFSNNKNLIRKNLGKEFNDLLLNNEDAVLENIKLCFDEVEIQSSFYIFPYSFDSDISGFIVLFAIKSIGDYKKMIKFISKYINLNFSL